MLTYAGLFGRAARLPGRAIGHKTARARSRLAEAAARQNPVPMQPAVRGIAHQDGSVPENTFEIFALALLPPDGFPAKHATEQAAPKRVINLKYPLQTLPQSTLPSGWLEPLGGTESLPFQFTRTPTSQLPVYSDLRNGRTRRLTVIRRYTGDVNELKDELRRLLGEETRIEQHAGRIEINGHHVLKLKRWLRRLGF